MTHFSHFRCSDYYCTIVTKMQGFIFIFPLLVRFLNLILIKEEKYVDNVM